MGKSKAEWVERRVRTEDGLSLFLRDYAGAAGEARLPILCLHGLTRNSRDFGDVAPYLAATGRRVLTMDVRGRGRSDRDPEPLNYNPTVYARDVAAAFEQLGIARAVFVGTSMGGLITMILATQRPELIAAAVINDVGPQLSPVGLNRILGYAGKPQARPKNRRQAAAYAERINKAAFPKHRGKDWRAFAERIFDEGPDGRPVLAYDPAISAAFAQASPDKPAPDMNPVFQTLAENRPLLLVHGAISDLLDAQGVALMRELAPDMGYVAVPDVGHAPMLTEPEARCAILNFLASVP